MAKQRELANAPLCPLHSIPMERLPDLPPLVVGRGVTTADIKARKWLDAWLRFRCPVEGCVRVNAVFREPLDILELVRDNPGLTYGKLKQKSGLSWRKFDKQMAHFIALGTIRAENAGGVHSYVVSADFLSCR